MKTHSLLKSTKMNIAQGKLEQSFEKQKDLVAGSYVSKSDSTPNNVSPQNENNVLQKAKDFLTS